MGRSSPGHLRSNGGIGAPLTKRGLITRHPPGLPPPKRYQPPPLPFSITLARSLSLALALPALRVTPNPTQPNALDSPQNIRGRRASRPHPLSTGPALASSCHPVIPHASDDLSPDAGTLTAKIAKNAKRQRCMSCRERPSRSSCPLRFNPPLSHLYSLDRPEPGISFPPASLARADPMAWDKATVGGEILISAPPPPHPHPAGPPRPTAHRFGHRSG
jgi:hypothetical protein